MACHGFCMLPRVIDWTIDAVIEMGEAEMRGQSYCDTCKKIAEASCPDGHKLPIIGLTVDVVVEREGKLALVKRADHGWTCREDCRIR